MQTFPQGVKVQGFYLTLISEAGLWYESLRATAVVCKLSAGSNIPE